MDFGRLSITWSTLHKSEEGWSMQRSFDPAHQFDPEGRHDLKQFINPSKSMSLLMGGTDSYVVVRVLRSCLSSRACSMWWRLSVACRGWSQPGTRLVTHWLQPISASLWSSKLPLILRHRHNVANQMCGRWCIMMRVLADKQPKQIQLWNFDRVLVLHFFYNALFVQKWTCHFSPQTRQ